MRSGSKGTDEAGQAQNKTVQYGTIMDWDFPRVNKKRTVGFSYEEERMKVRTDARRAAIVEAAAGLFEEFGYDGASMNELAKRLGGSKGTLYGYFESKELLFEAVVRRFATGHLSEAAANLEADNEDVDALRETLLHFAERMLRVLTDDTRAMACYRMVMGEAGRSDVGRLFHESGPSEAIAALSLVLAAAMKRGLLVRGDAHIAAQHFIALVPAEIQSRLFEREPKPIGRTAIRGMARRAVEMYLSGALPR